MDRCSKIIGNFGAALFQTPAAWAPVHVERPTPRYRQIVEGWSDEDSVRQIRKIFDAALLKTD